jgi:hypothetical protein
MKKIIFALAIASLSGCASAPKTITPVPFDSTHSFAYNIAAQTDLLMDHSPLRDFTKEEVAESKAKLKEYSSPSKVFGVAYMLMGNLTGIIDIAGGTITDMALGNHTAGQSRWIVMLPKSEFVSPKAAQDYIKDTIETASIDVIQQFGAVKSIDDKGNRTYHAITLDSVDYTVGLAERTNDETVVINEGNSLDLDSKSNFASYTYGTTKEAFYMNKLVISTPLMVVANYETKNTRITQNDLNLAITQKLPKGFYLYSPSFPRYRANGKIYTDMSIQTPAIYTQGHKYEFVKP